MSCCSKRKKRWPVILFLLIIVIAILLAVISDAKANGAHICQVVNSELLYNSK